MYKHQICLVVLLLPFSMVAQAQNWFASNPGGIPVKPLVLNEPQKEGWSLSSVFDGGQEIRTLYRDGVLHSTLVLTREQGRLVSREERDPGGTVLSRVSYRYDPRGNPRLVNADTSRPLNMSMDPGTVNSVNPRITEGHDTVWTSTEMDLELRPTSRSVTVNDQEQERTNWIRNPDGSFMQEISRDNNQNTTLEYNEQGQLIRKTVVQDGKLLLVQTSVWEDNKLVRQTERGQGQLSVRDLTWKDNTLIRETRTVDGKLTWKIETEQNQDSRSVETHFRDGKGIIRVYWNDGIREREEYLEDGTVTGIQDEQQ